MPSTLIFAKVKDQTVLPSTIDLCHIWMEGGKERVYRINQYDNPIPNRFLAPIDSSKIPAQVNEPPHPLPPQMYPKVWESVGPEGAGSDS
jgi:hypothetical protein